jgi:RND family efflux transporter MFP subunit
MKRWIKWIVIGLVIVLLALGVLRALSARKAAKEALEAQQDLQKSQPAVTLTAADILVAQSVDLPQSIDISGSVKAANSAFVKARVAGELQGLTVREGDVVKAGQIVARVDDTEFKARLRQAQQQAESARAQVDIAQRNFDNNRALVDQGFISKTALDSSIATLNSAQATYQAAQAGADVAMKSLDDAVLRAPISGQVAQRLAQPGERVAIDARVVEIVDLSRLELEASLSPADSLMVKVGQTATLTIEGASKAITARVVRVNPSAVAGSRAILAYLALDTTSGLRQGLFAQGQLATGMAHALAVPLNTVRTDKPQPYVQWVKDGAVVHTPVTLGARGDINGQTMVAVSGLPENAEVIGATVGPIRAATLVHRTKGTP